MRALLIKNADLILTMDSEDRQLRGHDILIEGSTIVQIGRNLESPPGSKLINGHGKLVLPGFVNTHDHMFQIFTRGITRIAYADNLFKRLQNRYQIWSHLNSEMVYISALVGFIRLMKSGCTLSSDNYYVFPKDVEDNYIDVEIEAAQELGLRFHPARGALSPDYSDTGIVPDNIGQTNDEVLKEFERLIINYHDPSDFSMLRIALGPTNPVTSTRSLLKETIKLAREYNVLAHTHLSESLLEEEWCKNVQGMRLLEYMESLDWVGPDVWFAHCLHLLPDEIKRLGEYGSGVAHCPVSNARNNGEIAPVFDMLEKGVKVGFGIDGGAGFGEMMAEIQTAMVLHRYKSGREAVNAKDILRIATKGGANVLGWDKLGSIEVGYGADLILINTNKLEYAGSIYDKITDFTFFDTDHLVNTSIINGSIVIDDGKVTNVNEANIVERANEISEKFFRRIQHELNIDY